MGIYVRQAQWAAGSAVSVAAGDGVATVLFAFQSQESHS
jgi:hypothetical protein